MFINFLQSNENCKYAIKIEFTVPRRQMKNTRKYITMRSTSLYLRRRKRKNSGKRKTTKEYKNVLFLGKLEEVFVSENKFHYLLPGRGWRKYSFLHRNLLKNIKLRSKLKLAQVKCDDCRHSETVSIPSCSLLFLSFRIITGQLIIKTSTREHGADLIRVPKM